MRFIAWTLSALCLAACAASASDDMTIVSKTTLNGKPSGTTTSYVTSDHSRSGETGGHEMIIDAKSGTMTTLDGAKKTYYTVTKQDMDDFNAKMKERMSSPEAKKGMEMMQGMAGEMAKSYEVKKTGETRKVGAWTCEEWVITMGEMFTMKECVTSEVKYNPRASEAFRAFGERMRGSSPFAPVVKDGESLSDKMKTIKGFPVATSTTTNVMGNKSTTESEVIEINHSAIPASTWEPPADYKKVANPMLKAFNRRG